jgi:hypothetical protein
LLTSACIPPVVSLVCFKCLSALGRVHCMQFNYEQPRIYFALFTVLNPNHPSFTLCISYPTPLRFRQVCRPQPSCSDSRRHGRLDGQHCLATRCVCGQVRRDARAGATIVGHSVSLNLFFANLDIVRSRSIPSTKFHIVFGLDMCTCSSVRSR